MNNSLIQKSKIQESLQSSRIPRLQEPSRYSNGKNLDPSTLVTVSENEIENSKSKLKPIHNRVGHNRNDSRKL